jgi:hypothetical protein
VEPHLLIPIVAIIMTFGTPIAIVAIVSINKARNTAELQKTLRMSIEKGQPLPTEFIESMSRTVPKAKNPMNDVRWGLILIAVSSGLFITAYFDNGMNFPGMSGFGAIPGLIGVALLILGVIGLNRKSAD